MKHYKYSVEWSEEEQEWMGTCDKFPLLSHFDKTITSAIFGIVGLVSTVVSDMEKNGEILP
jgi:hypothetical protein